MPPPRTNRRHGPQKMADVLSNLLARRGYARVQAVGQWQQAWQTAAGAQMAGNSRPGNVSRGVLEVTVRNSAVLQELTFQKKQLLKTLQKLMADQPIRDLRFRVGSID